MTEKVNCVIILALGLLWFQGVESQRQCETNWIHRSGFCYLFSETLSAVQSNWEDAREDCRERSSNLATIQSEDIWDWMVTKMTSGGLGKHWIGLRKTGNQFYWDDGTFTDKSNFFWTDDGQSENLNTCVVVAKDGWREELCTEESYYHICYKKGTARDGRVDAVVVTVSILASVFVLFILILLAYYMMPETEAKHEKLEKHVKRFDEQEAKRRRQRKGDLESEVQEAGNVRSKDVEKAHEVDEGRAKKTRKEGSDVESGRSQVGVVKGRTPQKVTVESRGKREENVESGHSKKADVKKNVPGTSSKGYENKAFDNNNE